MEIFKGNVEQTREQKKRKQIQYNTPKQKKHTHARRASLRDDKLKKNEKKCKGNKIKCFVVANNLSRQN